MARWIAGMRNTIAAARPPQPIRIQPVTRRLHDLTATLGAVSDIRHWLPTALDLSGPVAILADERAASKPPDRIVSAIAHVLDSPVLPSANTSAWIRLTDLAAASLAFVDIRADVVSEPERMLVTSAHGRSGAARAADALFHPNTQLRAAALPNSGAVELAAWAAPTWFVIVQGPRGPIACVTRSAVLAELLALGAHRLTERSRSIEAVTPWEEPTVQRLFELELDRGGHQVALRVNASLGSDREWIVRLAEVIGADVAAE